MNSSDRNSLLTEDILQVPEPGGGVVDVGWYPDGDPHGCFRCVVVRNDDWQNPVDLMLTPDALIVLYWLQGIFAGNRNRGAKEE